MPHGTPLPMPFANPFFVRELRAHSRKAWAPLSWLVLLSVLSPLSGFWIGLQQWDMFGPSRPIMVRGFVLLVVFGLHSAVCGTAGWRLGASVFGVEQQENTLESLRLIAASPWLWTLQKLVFPLYALLLVWLAAVPSYLALAMHGHALPSTLLPGLLLAGSVGLLTFGAALLAPPERLGLPLVSERLLPLTQRLELQSLRVVTFVLAWEVLGLVYEWVEAGSYDQRPRFDTHALFGRWPLRSDQCFELLLALFLGCALACAWASADPVSPLAQGLRRAARRLTAATGYLLLIALTWPGGHWLWRAVLVGVPAVQLLRARAEVRRARIKGHRRRNEDRRAAGEIAIVQLLSDNPVLIRDLRVALRGAGLWAGVLTQCTIILIIGGCAVVLISSGFLGLPRNLTSQYALRFYAGMMAALLWWGWLAVLFRMAMQGLVQWSAERRMRTIPQLLLSPLSAWQIVSGRWSAALISGVIAVLPWSLSLAVCWSWQDEGLQLTTSLVSCAWLLSMALMLSLGTAGSVPVLCGRGARFSISRCAITVVVTQVLFLFWSILQSPSTSEFNSLFVLMTLINAGLIPVFAVLSVRLVDSLRRRLSE